MNFDITTNGNNPAETLAIILSASESVTVPLQRIGAAFKSEVLLGFRASTNPYGEPWKPLRYRQGKPLILTGRLRESISYAVKGNTLFVGSNVQYGLDHLLGLTRQIGARTQVLRFDSRGRFQSRKAARRKRKGSIRIAFAQIRGYSVEIPQRLFLPIYGLPEKYANTALDILGIHFNE